MNITKYFFSLLLTCFVIIGSTYSQSTSTFMRKAGAPGMNGGLSLAETSDGGFVGTGQQQAGGAGGCDIYVYKVDACGTVEWERLFGNGSDEGGKYVQQTSDGGYIVAGLYNSPNYNVLLLKLDATGNLQWSKIFDFGYGLFVQQTTDGGYILSGFDSGGPFGGNDVLLIKTDANGTILWKKVYGGAGNDWGNYVEQTLDKGYIIAGYTGSYGAGGNDLFLLKVDSVGTKQWDKTYGGPGDDGGSSWGISGQLTSDGGYMVCGNSSSYGAGSNDILFVKTDNTGNFQWAKTYGGVNDDQPRFAHQTSNGGYIVCGYTTSFGHGDLDAYLVKTDVSGNLQWSKAYGGPAYDKGQMVREVSDKGFALSMITDNFGADGNPNGEYFDPIFMKTDSLGVVGCNEANCATVVNNVTPSVGTGFQEAVPAISATVPPLVQNSYTASDLILCKHCITVPAFVPSDTTVCLGDTIFFYNTTSIGVRCFENWYINGTLFNGDKDTLPVLFTTSGYHVIQLVASCGNATDTNSIVIHVYDVPVAAFTSSKVCKGTPTQFSDHSTIASGSITNWNWNFGDGSPFSSVHNPSHLYANSGIDTATLIVSNIIGCSDTVSHPVQVYYNPTANFTFNNVCLRDSMHFTNTSSVDVSTTIARYLWDFGDGSATSTLKNPVHYYITSGTFNVTLLTVTADTCSNATSLSVKVFDPPKSSFTFSNVCLIDSSSFINTTLSPTMGTTANWSWNFGDGSPVNTTQLNPHHLYGTPGDYTITLISHSSNLGCPDTAKDSIKVFPMPTAKFVFTNVCLNKPMNFNDSSTVESGTMTGWSWNFGDSTPLGTVQNPNHTYDNFGTFNVSLISTTNNGCKDTIAKNVVVHPLPVAQYTAANVCDDSIVHFNDASHIVSTDTIQVWKWNYGDSTAINNSPSNTHLYGAPGSYSVKLLTVSQFGCRDSITKILVVNPNPVVNFNSDKIGGCEVLCINFQDSSHILTGHDAHWLWGFGDQGSISSSQNSNHCYSNDSIFAPITFNISLKVTSDSGCVSMITKNNYITVYPNPAAHFTVQPEETTIVNPVITIKDASIGTNFWNWNFGDSDTTSVHNPPPHTYADTGTYMITLIVSTQYTCSDMTHQTVIIDPDFTFYIPNSFTPNGDDINDTFTGRGIFIKKFEMSIFDRWGNLIFFSEDINKPWDGKANHGSDMAQEDVYVYSINVTDFKNKKHNYKGIVTLVK
jgi:gliding motility-associated-like protein